MGSVRTLVVHVSNPLGLSSILRARRSHLGAVVALLGLFLAAAGCGGGDGADGTADPAEDVLVSLDLPDDETTDPEPDVSLDDASEVSDTDCPPTACEARWQPVCQGTGGFVTCDRDADGCLVEGPRVDCGGGVCALGQCSAACREPTVMLLVDRSSAMTEAWPWTAAALGQVTEEGLDALSMGIRTFPGDIDGCTPDEVVEPAPANTSAIDGALAKVSKTTTAPLAAALRGLDTALGAPSVARAVVVILGGDERCEDDEAVFAAVDALRLRGTRVYVITAGFGADNTFADALAVRGDTDSAASATNEIAMANRLRDVLTAVGVCCIDPDDDDHGPYCSAGSDCNQLNGAVTQPDCSGAECGDDGCGGSCGVCPTISNGTLVCSDGACLPECATGHHACDGACVSNDAVATCGEACEPCPTVANGTATCDGSSCGINCADGFHTCDGACVDSSSTDHCGVACSPCPTIANSQATCDAGTCGLECIEGHRQCDEACVLCPDDPGIAAFTCDSGTCVAESCSDGFVACGDTCCDTLRVDVAPAGGVEATTAWPELMVTALGAVHIAYHRVTPTGGEARHATGALETWTTEQVAEGTSPASGAWTRLVPEASGTPHLAFRGGDGAGSAVITRAIPAETGFTTTPMVDTFGAWPYQAGDFALGVTLAGTSVLAYPSGDRLSLATASGSAAPTRVTVAATNGATYSHAPALSVANDGIITVLYLESATDLMAATGGGTSWSREPVATGLGGLGQHRIDLVATTAGHQACYFDSQPGTAGVYSAKHTEAGWSTELIDDLGEQACSVAVAPNGLVHVAYRRIGGALTLAIRYPVGWSTEVIHTPAGPLGYRWPSLALGKDGSLHVAYFDHAAARLRYLYRP